MKVDLHKVRLTVIIICLLTLVYSSTRTVLALMDYNKAESEYESIACATSTQPTNITGVVTEYTSEEFSSTQYAVPNFSVDFESLIDTNSDCIGWIYIPDLGISYPVVRSSDNAEYLKTTFNGTKSSSGCIFSDCRIDSPFRQCTILYGHNMKSGTMFAGLYALEDMDSTDTVKVWIYLTDGTIQSYSIESVQRVSAYDETIYDLSQDASTLVLSTCVKDSSRLAVICRKTATYI